MKNNYLLDTNICIALLRGNRDVAQKLIDPAKDVVVCPSLHYMN
jgi:predicted nucleic acid-binding protein